jgi:hypothetical protein
MNRILINDENKLMVMETTITTIVTYGGCAKIELILYISYRVEALL